MEQTYEELIKSINQKIHTYIDREIFISYNIINIKKLLVTPTLYYENEIAYFFCYNREKEYFTVEYNKDNDWIVVTDIDFLTKLNERLLSYDDSIKYYTEMMYQCKETGYVAQYDFYSNEIVNVYKVNDIIIKNDNDPHLVGYINIDNGTSEGSSIKIYIAYCIVYKPCTEADYLKYKIKETSLDILNLEEDNKTYLQRIKIMENTIEKNTSLIDKYNDEILQYKQQLKEIEDGKN